MTSLPLVSRAAPVPPVAEKRPYVVPSPHGGRTDEYYWLRDDTRKDPAVLAYLEAENAYREAMTAHTQATEEALYTEIVARIKQDDASVPYRKAGWWYYTRFDAGKEYPIHARKRETLTAAEEVLLDGNTLAAGQKFFQIQQSVVSPDARILAWSQDNVGRRQWTLHFKDLTTGEVLPDRLENTTGEIAWANDNRTVLYVEKDPVTLLGVRVRKHVLGTAPATDAVVYEEKDNTFYLSVGKSRSDRFIEIVLDQTLTTETLVADASDPALVFRPVLPRERGHDYTVEDAGDDWIIRTNWQAKNFRVIRVPMARVADRTAWQDVIPHRTDGFVQNFAVFKDFLAVGERAGGLRQIRIKAWADGAEHVIGATEPAYTMALAQNAETDTPVVRYTYTSLVTPSTTYDYDMGTRTQTLLKRTPVLGTFDPANYQSEFLRAPARDGTLIPVSIVYRKGFRRDGTAALLQYAYGSYGISSDPTFSSARLSLLDRGAVVAIAHIRGGQEMGRDWYESGKLLRKQNTFTDFIDVTDYLVKQGYAAKDRVAAEGGSAGGLLMGAIMNLAGEKYRAVVAHVPFVDVVTTMLDETIPLTTNEYDEWGNPADKAYYDYMLAYSPYDQVAAKAYPATLVTAGLWDSQVQYFEPAKWVARLRARKTDNNPLLLNMNMSAGHGGASGRFQRFREVAESYAFLFDQWGISAEVAPRP
ncbi:Protease 2 [Lacunisphaera limnophila]|uniref:Protease 2 n=2 Tax=Lacunisphaera limnophila TaxID=1838286 RepID=A0A1D8AS11_9BACT|nr:Protease 2 [Lacunisphaera limnophila]